MTILASVKDTLFQVFYEKDSISDVIAWARSVLGDEYKNISDITLTEIIDNHDSDCETHNMPAYPNEECNCSLSDN